MQDIMATGQTTLGQVWLEGNAYFQISDVGQMRPFFMSIVSDADHWLFIGSNGGLSAGRKDAQHALFPYYTDDKIIESVDHTGGQWHVWEPFSIRFQHLYHTSNHLYKNGIGIKDSPVAALAAPPPR